VAASCWCIGQVLACSSPSRHVPAAVLPQRWLHVTHTGVCVCVPACCPTVIARRYGIPMMSIRDAIYDEMMDPGNPFGIKRSGGGPSDGGLGGGRL
jgi:hypothetical protein